MIESWLTGIRDHPKRPPLGQSHALTMLALRMDWRTGCGFASTQGVSDDANVTARTVIRATVWAREFGYLVQTRRGHYVSPGRVIASEWRLTMPSQGDTGDTLAWPLEAHP